MYKTCILIILPWYKNDLLLKTSGNIENILSGPMDPYKANCVVKYIQLMRVKNERFAYGFLDTVQIKYIKDIIFIAKSIIFILKLTKKVGSFIKPINYT